jgi:3-oxoacyl-[acyl-carrier protein] reductase
MDFTEKIALITGGSRGIGRMTCLMFARRGATVVVNYAHGAQAAQRVVQEIVSNGGKAMAIQANVAEEKEAAAMIDKVIETFGRLDILVNNAGITRDSLLIRMKKADWDEVIGVNLTGAFNCLQAAAKKMVKQRHGVIVNVSSIVGVIGNMGQANYTAAKAGLIGLTKTVAKELASRNIRVNAVAPGFITTEMTDALTEDLKKKIVERIPMGRFGASEEVAEVISWLASDRSSYITGQVVLVDGGLGM